MPVEKGIPKPPERNQWFPQSILNLEAWQWLTRVFDAFPKVSTYSVTLDPGSVSANTSAEQTFTVTGLRTNDIVYVNKPTATAGLVVGGFRVTANDTLGITFGNLTGTPIDPASEEYLVVAIRR